MKRDLYRFAKARRDMHNGNQITSDEELKQLQIKYDLSKII